MSSDLSVSFIVPSKNEASVIADCLFSLDELCGDNDEIIVVDNLSTDATPQIAGGFPNVTVIRSQAETVAGVRNDGANRAKGSVLAFVDADCLLESEWRKQLVEMLSDETVVATGGGLTFPRGATWVEKAWMCGWAAPSGPVTFISTANMAVREETFRALGGFDEGLETDEDTDFSRRVRSVFGARALRAHAGMTAVHLGSARTLGEHWRRQYWHAAGLLASVRKHGPDKAFYMTCGFAILHVLGLLSLIAVPGWYAAAALFGGAAIVPIVTALYRLRSTKCIRWLPHLMLLYALFYYARCFRLLKGLSGKHTGNRAEGHGKRAKPSG